MGRRQTQSNKRIKTFDSYNPKKHLKIPDLFVVEKIKPRPTGNSDKEKENEQILLKKSILPDQFSRISSYYNDFKIHKGNLYYAKIDFDNLTINSKDYENFLLKFDLHKLQYGRKSALIAIDTNKFEAFKKGVLSITKYINNIKSIAPYTNRIDEDLLTEIVNLGEKNYLVEIDFFPNLEENQYVDAINSIYNHLLKHGKKINKQPIKCDDFYKINLTLSGTEIKEIGEGVATISNISQVPEIIIEVAESHLDEIYDDNPENPLNDKISINVIDSGVNYNHPYLKNLINYKKDYSGVTTDCIDNTKHGTFVSGLICYGEKLESRIFKPDFKINVAKLIDSKNMNADSVEKNEFYKIFDIIDDFKIFSRIFNLSMTFTNKTKSIIKFCEKLDTKIRENDLIFCVSTGNIDSDMITKFYESNVKYPAYFLTEKNMCLIQPPADCCNVLTVGSIAKKGDEYNPYCIALYQEPSPFTRRGPTKDGRLKPEVVSYGGNFYYKNNNGVGASKELSVVSLSSEYLSGKTNDLLRYSNGTSFSAPLIARLAAKIIERYGPISSNLIRAMIVNSCSELGDIKNENFKGIDKKTLFGFGIPIEDFLLNSYTYKVTLYHEGKIGINCRKHIKFFVPKVLKKTKGIRKLCVTLAYNPPVDSNFIEGYTQVVLKPKILKGDKLTNITKTDNVQKGRSNWDSNHSFSTVKNFVYEWDRFGYGEMWIIELDSEGYGIDENFIQDYALVVTIETDNESVNLYDTIVTKMGIQIEEREKVEV